MSACEVVVRSAIGSASLWPVVDAVTSCREHRERVLVVLASLVVEWESSTGLVFDVEQFGCVLAELRSFDAGVVAARSEQGR